MSEKKQASIQSFLKPVRSIDLPIQTPSAPELKLINKAVNKSAKSHIWCGDSSNVEEIMDFIFGRAEKNDDSLVTQFLNRMTRELGQCVDCLDQYYAYIARIQSSSLMDSQAGDTSLLADRLQQWNIERLALGFKLIEECEGDARLNYIEDMLVPNWQIVCLETLKDTNYLQAPPIQKAFTKTFVNILTTHNVSVSHNAPGLYYLLFHHELELREWAFSTVDNFIIDTGSNIFEKLLPVLRNILGFLKKEEELKLLGVTKANNVLIEGLCIIITKLPSELVTVFLCSFPGILQTIISLSLSLPDLKLAILTTLEYVLQIDDVWNDQDPKFISDWLLTVKPSSLTQETRSKMLNIIKRILETVDIDEKHLVPFQRTLLDYLQRMSNNRANDVVISTILKDYENNADVAIALCNTWSVLALNMASQKIDGAISLCQKALEYDTLKAMNFVDAVFKHQHPRIQHEWALPLWRAILHTQHELPASINDAVILSVGALVLVDLNDRKLKVEKICTTLREVFVGFEIFLKRLVTNIHLLEGFVSDTTLPSVMFYLLSTPHKDIHTHSLELYKKWSHSTTLHDCISYALDNHKKEFLESVQGALAEVLKYYLHGYKSSVSKILFTLTGIVTHLNPEEGDLDQLALTLTWDLLATFMICFQEMKFGDDANALASRFFKLFEATLDTISKFPDSQIFSDVIQKPIWQQYVEFFSDIPDDFKGLWTKQLQMIASFLRLYDEDSLDSIIAYCQTYLSGYRKYWEELLDMPDTHTKAKSTMLDNLPTASQLNLDLNESQGSTGDLPPVTLEQDPLGDEYDLLELVNEESLQAPNRVVKNALQTMMDNQKMTKDMHTKKDAFDKHHNKPSPFVNLFEMKPLRSSKKSSKPISVSLPFKQPQQQVPTHAHHVPANTYQQPQQPQAQQGAAVRPRPRFPTRRGGPSLIDKLKKEVAKVSVKNSALDMPRAPPRSYSPPIRSVYSHTSRSIAEPERERRQTVVLDKGKDERIAFREKQREFAKRRALFFPSLQQFHQQILKWDYKKLDQQTSTASLTTVPDNFEDIDEYKEVFYPLLVEEFKALLERGKREENDSNMPCKFKCLRRTLADNFAEVILTDLPPNHNYNMFSESDMVLVSQEDPTDDNLKSYVLGIIEKMTFLDKSILVKTTKGDLSAWIHEGGSYYLKKMEHISTINREYQSLAAVENLRLRQQILTPAIHSYKFSLDKGFKSRLSRMYNTSQLAAIDASVSNEGFVLIQGPPGTGKTKTIEGILSVLLMNKIRDDDTNTNVDEIKSPHVSEKILVVAPSNAAVDELAARLTTKGLILLNDRDMDLVKNNKFSLETKSTFRFTYDESIQGYRYFPYTVRVGPAQKNMPEHLQRISIENLINAKLTEQARHEEFRELERMSTTIDSNAPRQPQLKSVFNQEKKKNRAEEIEEKNKQRKSIEISILSKATIVCTTLSSSGHELFSKLTHGFDTVIIDEAAQAVELSTLIPLRYNCKRCIMVGDPNQLPATVLSKTAASFKYEQSLFQRFVNNGFNPVLLTVQYRMHPAIRKFPGKHFYNDELRDGITEQDRECEFHGNPCFKPTCFFDIKQSVQSQKAGSTSLRNAMEAQFIAKLIEILIELYPNIDFENQIGVLSPYKQQLDELRTQINRQLSKNNMVDEAVIKSIEINTVDGFQGREKNIIIFSCVRAAGSGNSIGFLSDVRRMNVALTRAKMSLWVVGNSISLKNNSHWRDFLHYMRQTDSLLEVANLSSFFKNIEEAKADESSAEKEPATRGTKRKLDEKTRITFNNNNSGDIDLNEEYQGTNNTNNNTNESSGDADSYYQWKNKRRKIDDTRQSVTSEPLFDLNSDNANDIPYDTTNDTHAVNDDMARLTVTIPDVERKKSPARSDGDFATGGERSIRRIDFAAIRKEKEREARVKAKMGNEQPRPASLRGSNGASSSTSIKGNDDDMSARQREYKRPGVARSGSSGGMTRVNPPLARQPPPSSSPPKKKKQLQTLTTDNFFDTTPSVFVPKKAMPANPPKQPAAPSKVSAPPKRPSTAAPAPKKNSGNVLDSILSSLQK